MLNIIYQFRQILRSRHSTEKYKILRKIILPINAVILLKRASHISYKFILYNFLIFFSLYKHETFNDVAAKYDAPVARHGQNGHRRRQNGVSIAHCTLLLIQTTQLNYLPPLGVGLTRPWIKPKTTATASDFCAC